MNEVWYIAVEKFGPGHKAWEGYVQWANLPQLRELVCLDVLLCPNVIRELSDEDWDYVTLDDDSAMFFRDRRYLTSRVSEISNKQILAVVKEPSSDQSTRLVDDFEFAGYDLAESGGVSALTNCGGYPESFDNGELNEFGLLPAYPRARQVQQALYQNNPSDDHADTDLWAIWRLRNDV